MRNVVGNVWNLLDEYDAICLTTNGTVKKDGTCVMGRGIALEAKTRYPGIDKVLGDMIKRHLNHAVLLGTVGKTTLLSFPVKHNWYEEADIELIRRSAYEMVVLADTYGFEHVLIPRPGCGNGKLNWKDVEPVISEILDDRFDVISFK